MSGHGGCICSVRPAASSLLKIKEDYQDNTYTHYWSRKNATYFLLSSGLDGWLVACCAVDRFGWCRLRTEGLPAIQLHALKQLKELTKTINAPAPHKTTRTIRNLVALKWFWNAIARSQKEQWIRHQGHWSPYQFKKKERHMRSHLLQRMAANKCIIF